MAHINTIIFDLGGVLIDWNPRYVFREVFQSDEKADWFIENICTLDWNEQQDEGYPIADAVEEKVKEFPTWENEIRTYYSRWADMLKGPIPGTVSIFSELKKSGRYKLYALTNWSAELFPVARSRYDFLQWFDGIVVSGEEKMRKPAPEFYERLLYKFNVIPGQAVFIDDNLLNIESAATLGLNVIHFTTPDAFQKKLKQIL
jgi:2-haloacid dehalogenase